MIGNVHHNNSWYPNYNHGEFMLTYIVNNNSVLPTGYTVRNNLTFQDLGGHAGEWSAPQVPGLSQAATIPFMDVQLNAYVLNPPFTTLAKNLSASSYSPYPWGLTNSAPAIGGTQTGYVANEIIEVQAGCAVNPQYHVKTASAGAITAAEPWESGNCASRPLGTNTATVSLGVLTAAGGMTTGSGTGATITMTTAYTEQVVSGYGLWLSGLATNTTTKIKNNALDNSSPPALSSGNFGVKVDAAIVCGSQIDFGTSGGGDQNFNISTGTALTTSSGITNLATANGC